MIPEHADPSIFDSLDHIPEHVDPSTSWCWGNIPEHADPTLFGGFPFIPEHVDPLLSDSWGNIPEYADPTLFGGFPFIPEHVDPLFVGFSCLAILIAKRIEMAGKPTNMSQIKQLLILQEKGKRIKTIARTIGISKNTVKAYCQKLDALSSKRNEPFIIQQLNHLPEPEHEQITRRWKRHIKDKLGIEADFYSLKHLNTDETAALLDLGDAAAHNSHTSTVITLKHYAFGEKARQQERIKKVGNSFAG